VSTDHPSHDQQRKLFERAQRVIPGGVNSPVRAFRAVGGTPRFITRAEGAYMWDAEGKRYIDYIGSWGPMILGHGHPAVLEAVQKARRTASASARPPSARSSWPRRSSSLVPSVEQVRLVSSGTEAGMSALRLARGFHRPQQDRQVRGLLPRPCRRAAGQGRLGPGHLRPPHQRRRAAEVVQHTLVLEYNNIAQLEEAFATHGARSPA
jgi:glutamate-1-semialdehyde 2,1-aminomutase